jgi:hypothetical protein
MSEMTLSEHSVVEFAMADLDMFELTMVELGVVELRLVELIEFIMAKLALELVELARDLDCSLYDRVVHVKSLVGLGTSEVVPLYSSSTWYLLLLNQYDSCLRIPLHLGCIDTLLLGRLSFSLHLLCLAALLLGRFTSRSL